MHDKESEKLMFFNCARIQALFILFIATFCHRHAQQSQILLMSNFNSKQSHHIKLH